MKITKGMKLTPEQKAQRAASRARNEPARQRERDHKYGQWLLAQADKKDAEAKSVAQDSRAACLARLEQEFADLKAGNLISIKIDLKAAPEIKAALAYFQRVNYVSIKELNPSFVACSILRLALAHPEQISAWISKLCRYRRDEGFEGMEGADSKIIAGWTAGRKEYKAKARA